MSSGRRPAGYLGLSGKASGDCGGGHERANCHAQELIITTMPVKLSAAGVGPGGIVLLVMSVMLAMLIRLQQLF